MNFIKLYNLILLSIITLNKATRAQLLKDLLNHLLIENALNDIAKEGNVLNKAADFIAKFFKSKELTDTTDKRIQQIVDVFKRVPNYNIQTKISLEDFLKENDKYLTRDLKEDTKDIIKYIDRNYSEIFTLKEKLDRDVVIYRVDESSAGQRAVRKIIDICLGDNRNPWCLAARHNGNLNSAWSYWSETYTAFPKHIAFQNGKLIGFCANSHGNCTWWNTKDNGTDGKLELLDHTYIKTRSYKWTPEEKKNMWIVRNGLKLNPKTNRYDSEGNVTIEKDNLLHGGFIIPFGVIKGDFNCSQCGKELTDISNAPIEVKGSINYDGCVNIPNYEEYWKNRFIYTRGLKLNQLTGRYDCRKPIMIETKDLINHSFPVPLGVMYNDFDCSKCYNDLTTWLNGPTEIQGEFYFYQGQWKKGEKNSELVNDSIQVKLIQNTKMYKKWKDSAAVRHFIKYCNLIYNLKTKKYDYKKRTTPLTPEDFYILKGAFSVPLGTIYGDFDIRRCTELTSIKNCPDDIRGFLYYNDNQKDLILNSLMYKKYTTTIPKKFIRRESLTLNPQTNRYDGDSVILTNEYVLNGNVVLPLGRVEHFNCYDCDNLTSWLNCPTEIRGKFTYNPITQKHLFLNTEMFKKYTEKEKKWYIETNNLIYNKETGRYDCKGTLKIIADRYGYFPVPLGVIEGKLDCRAWNITSWLNGPTDVKGILLLTDLQSEALSKCKGKNINNNDTQLNSFIKENDLVLNKETGCYDTTGSVYILTKHNIIKNGHFPIKFGEIGGNFFCGDTSLTTLKGGPTYVGGMYYINLTKIRSFKGAPKSVGKLNAGECRNLLSLDGFPQEVRKDFICTGCYKLKDLDKIKNRVKGKIIH